MLQLHMQHANSAGHMIQAEAQALSSLTLKTNILAKFSLSESARLRYNSASCSHCFTVTVAYLVQQLRKRNPLTVWSHVANINVKYCTLLLVIHQPGKYRLDKSCHSTRVVIVACASTCHLLHCASECYGLITYGCTDCMCRNRSVSHT